MKFSHYYRQQPAEGINEKYRLWFQCVPWRLYDNTPVAGPATNRLPYLNMELI